MSSHINKRYVVVIAFNGGELLVNNYNGGELDIFDGISEFGDGDSTNYSSFSCNLVSGMEG